MLKRILAPGLWFPQARQVGCFTQWVLRQRAEGSLSFSRAYTNIENLEKVALPP